ncbi:sugar phosphate permease|uniref:Sugar phosphate permease n=1 Tax=Brenneria salicis ATCC 15712 = DSM 30166 TaxID=714314 RepID=A0A366I0Q2_9GAMM|nr:MFS transporter [Brenneria salicis]NMN92602.1 sugar phosphate permease [Brenneria salicis ATCC 15712 = DSM 30166]RBP59053.1 sugar phosphate permease [Brenneria salicis ATCC 15712 = DSM 30166]RLM29677.1 MFS transporter [Brenneria salicis ATCC 15712 = DSM 30166]
MTGQKNDMALTKITACSANEHAPHRAADRNGFGMRGWTVIVFQAVMFWIAAGAVTHGLNVMLPALSQTYDLDYSTLLALATPASWASIPAGPICAWLCEKKGPRFNVIFCLIACGLCFGLLGYCGSLIGFTLLFAGVCFFGTGFAYVGGTAIMTSWFVRKAGLALGWCTVGQTFSSAFFVPTLAALFMWLGVRYGFWGISIMMFIMALLVRLFVANKPEDIGLAPDNDPLTAAELSERRREHDRYVCSLSVRQLLRMRDVWFMGIATGAIYIMLVGVVSQIVPRLMEMGYELNTAIFYMTLSALFGTLGAYGWGWLNHRLGVKRALLIYTLWWMAAVVINLFAHQTLLLWISLLMIGFSLPGATNLSTALIATKFPRRLYVRAIGIVHPIQSVVRCFAFSILAFGLAYLGGYTGAYLLLVGVGAVALLLIWRTDVTPVAVIDQP